MGEAKATILIVDDKACIRTTISLVLVELGYDVRTAGDGISALREIRKENPEILLSDLNMPGMSGFELLSVVRRRFPGILVIAMSGSFSGKEVPSGVPADAFYQKGSNTSALLQILRTPPANSRQLTPTSTFGSSVAAEVGAKNSSEAAEVQIVCPDCLRSLSPARDDDGKLWRQQDCIYCGNSLHSAAAQPEARMKRRPARQNDGFANAARSAASSTS